MNACFQSQSSGHKWPSAALNQTAFSPSATRGNALFENLEGQMARFQAQTDDLLAQVRKNFILPRDPAAESFLNDHKSLPEILIESLPALRAAFGESAVLTFNAPLDEGGSRTAYATVVWPGSLATAREALARFDDEWWIRRASTAFGRLTFTYELV